MEKITNQNVGQIQVGDFIAKYPVEGEEKDFFEIAEKDNCYVYVVTQTFLSGEIELGVSVLGFSETYTLKLRKKPQDLINGFWWCNVDTKIFS